ncbi:MAG: phenylacetate--CoA ligase family protein [Candidatus Pacearchaeota archaeon]
MRRFILKTVLALSGKNIFKRYKYLKKREFISVKENKEYQEEKLKKLLTHAYNNVPYYHKVLAEVKVIEYGKVNLKNFDKIPILTKDIIRKEGSNLYSRDHKKRKSYENTSGGSTGEPVKFLQDKDTWTEGMAIKWLFYSFICDYPCKLVKLWGSERDILKGSYGIKGSLKNKISQRKLLNAFKMSEENMKSYVNKINSFKPKIIEAYVESIYEFSKFIKKNDIKIFYPKGIITSAGTLYPEMKELIEEVFHCKVYNRYGSREVGDMACTCEENKMHINIFDNLLELLDKDLNPIKTGKTGDVYITTLNNFSMPLIRYKIGDIGKIAFIKKCKCGRGMPVIKGISGRNNSILKTKKGSLDGTALTTSFYFLSSIEKYKLIQKTMDKFTLMVIINNKKKWKEDKKVIEKKFRQILGNEINVNFKIVNKIPSLKNGKYQYIISEVI